MGYTIFFDESNKVDQPNGGYSYYGAFGTTEETMNEIVQEIEQINQQMKATGEMHFAEYKNDKDFGQYFKSINTVMKHNIHINIFIVNNEDAKLIGNKMSVTTKELRKLFYVKIPERLFYGMTRYLNNGDKVKIVVDDNQEYKDLDVYNKLEEQMNAHSAYRNKGYKVDSVVPKTSDDSIPLQIIDVLMGICIFLMEKHYKNVGTKEDDIILKVKSDLIYRFLIEADNISKIQSKVNLYKWEGNEERISKVNLGDYISEFMSDKTQYDVKEMIRLEKMRLSDPDKTTKHYRINMGYTNSQLKTIQGYIDQLDGKGRNSYFLK
ncbi:hypothetical protein D5F52_26855 (plasmid) [Brevibacillus laterosporus]|uniref:DUF3800 domain-containing protein n=1 Tax=Brevibacillus laterosporus TaxID=1465 RepID=UPI000E6BE14E|nr:DUF3800 domain-containing protein [Brevibacillus laterosporus]AYB41774.1 hypothetical protein D5F52_26855 [Brevibacillus laterosporus]